VLTAQILSLLAHDSSTTIILTAILNITKANLTTAIININLKWTIYNSIGVSSATHIHTDMTVHLKGRINNCSNSHGNGSIIPRNLNKPFPISNIHEPCRP
jgi:hypothetical protein